jgi:two-component system KDP operon response regulator KdpE
MTLRVLLVEDDRELRTTLRDALAVEGYKVYTAASLREGMSLLTHVPGQTTHPAGDAGVDLILLDLGLPDGDGETLLAAHRRRHVTPVIVISARQGDGQKIRLLDGGADDYLVKPFGIGELLARMRVSLRHRGTSLKASITRYADNGLCIDLASREVSLAGRPVHLTPTEFELLARLVRSAGQVVTHRQLLTDVWGAEYAEHTHYLRLYMAQLRAKLEADPAEPQRLLTDPGVGYRLVEGETTQ